MVGSVNLDVMNLVGSKGYEVDLEVIIFLVIDLYWTNSHSTCMKMVLILMLALVGCSYMKVVGLITQKCHQKELEGVKKVLHTNSDFIVKNPTIFVVEKM